MATRNAIEKKWKEFEGKMNFGTEKRLELYGMLISMIRDGLPLDAALRRLHERMAVRKRPTQHVLKTWIRKLDEGRPFSEAVRGYIPSEEMMLLSAGERANNIAIGMEEARNMTLAKKKIIGALSSSLMGPVVMLSVLMAMLIWFSTSILPVVAKVAKGRDLPPHLTALFKTADFIRDNWMFVVGGIVAVVVVAMWSLPRWRGRGRAIAEYIPPWSIYKIYASSTFMISLSALLKARMPLPEAIKYISDKSTPWMRDHLRAMQKRISRGMDYGSSMDTGMLNDDIADQIMIYAQVKDFDTAIKSVGQKALEDGIKNIEKKAGMANLASKILFGGVITWLLVSFLSLGTVLQSSSQPGKGGTSMRR